MTAQSPADAAPVLLPEASDHAVQHPWVDAALVLDADLLVLSGWASQPLPASGGSTVLLLPDPAAPAVSLPTNAVGVLSVNARITRSMETISWMMERDSPSSTLTPLAAIWAKSAATMAGSGNGMPSWPGQNVPHVTPRTLNGCPSTSSPLPCTRRRRDTDGRFGGQQGIRTATARASSQHGRQAGPRLPRTPRNTTSPVSPSPGIVRVRGFLPVLAETPPHG